MAVEGKKIVSEGVYLEIIAGERLVFTDFFSEGWKPAADPFMTAIIELKDGAGGGTVCTVTARHRSPEARQKHEEMGFREGWGTVAAQLEAYARTLA